MTPDENPYSAPAFGGVPIKSSNFVSGDSYPLATRWQRFAGNFIDYLILFAIAMPMYIAVLFVIAFSDPGYVDRPETFVVQMIDNVSITIAMVIGFLAVNGYLLAKQGQTVGKFVMGTRIVSDRTGELVPLSRIFLMRYLLLWILVLLPFIGSLINLADSLSIFRENRKCLHDDFAHTKVVSTSVAQKKRTLPDQIEAPSFPAE